MQQHSAPAPQSPTNPPPPYAPPVTLPPDPPKKAGWSPPMHLSPADMELDAPPQGWLDAPLPKTTGEYLLILLLGLLPLLGVVLCLLWAFGSRWDKQVQTLARAMLWLHGIALLLAVALLAVWVLFLAGGTPLLFGAIVFR